MTEDILLRDRLVELGLLTRDVLGELALYNYTRRCAKQQAWDDITLNSRGIVFNLRTGECVARPFPKIFHLHELAIEPPWDTMVSLEEKVDGHLGILYRAEVEGPHDWHYFVTTRGRFSSPSANLATEMLSENHNLMGLDDNLTLLFEIIHPQTRVILDYEDLQELVLLGAIKRNTGAELSVSEVDDLAAEFAFPRPTRYSASATELERRLTQHADDPRHEGFVARFAGGLRVKFKTAWYLTGMVQQMRSR